MRRFVDVDELRGILRDVDRALDRLTRNRALAVRRDRVEAEQYLRSAGDRLAAIVEPFRFVRSIELHGFEDNES